MRKFDMTIEVSWYAKEVVIYNSDKTKDQMVRVNVGDEEEMRNLLPHLIKDFFQNER